MINNTPHNLLRKIVSGSGKPAIVAIVYPEGITQHDTIRPEYEYRKRKPWGCKNPEEQPDPNLGCNGQIQFHHATGFGWVIATLPISRARNAGYIDRTYGIRVDTGGTCRIGSGPHVGTSFTLFLRPNRVEALQKYIDLYDLGMGKSNTVRDRISTRRAQGVENRAAGLHSWRW